MFKLYPYSICNLKGSKYFNTNNHIPPTQAPFCRMSVFYAQKEIIRLKSMQRFKFGFELLHSNGVHALSRCTTLSMLLELATTIYAKYFCREKGLILLILMENFLVSDFTIIHIAIKSMCQFGKGYIISPLLG